MNIALLKREAARRQGIMNACFAQQVNVMKSVSRMIAILTSRRAGKTNTVIRKMVLDALDHPNAKYAYIGLSRNTAENIVWKELEFINEQHDLGLDLQGYRLRAIFPNGATLTLYGADMAGWLKKFKGSKYRQVCIDEAGEFDIDLSDLVWRVLKPCLTDQLGVMYLIGTPGIIPSGYWWQVTRPDIENRAKGWDFFNWHTRDNPFIADQYEIDLADLKNVYGEELYQLPWFIREWMGQWAFDTDANVYKYRSERNDVDSFTTQRGDRYICAVDPGYKDAAGFLVGVYNPDRTDKLTFIDCYKEAGMSFDGMADKVREFADKYPGLRVIGDPDSAHFLAELRNRHGINVEDAIKAKKQDAIGIFNNDLISGRTKLLMPACRPYAEEMFDLKKYFKPDDERKEDGIQLGDWKEHPRQANDLCDCALYIHRSITNYTYKEPEPPIDYGTPEYFKQKAEKLREQARKRVGGERPWWKQ